MHPAHERAAEFLEACGRSIENRQDRLPLRDFQASPSPTPLLV